MNTIKEVCEDLRRGKMIILVDSKDRENEGDIICAGEKITPANIFFMAKNGRGLICAPISEERRVELDLPLMQSKHNTPLQQCNFTASVDARKGISTGISATDRTRTIKVLANPKTKPEDLSQPGHVFPLAGRKGGVLVRAGHTEGTLDLLKLAGLKQIGVLCEVMGDDGKMLSGIKLNKFAKKHRLKIIDIQSIIEYRRTQEKLIKREVEAVLPTEFGKFRAIIYTTTIDNKEHIALVMGKPSKDKPTLIRVHSECITGDVFYSTHCDCSRQLNLSLARIAEKGEGILLYMRQEGRGIGLVNKLKAYNLQDKGYDTVEANKMLGFNADLRDYGIGAQILADLGVSKIHLMTNNPKKIIGLGGFGLKVVKRIPIEVAPNGKRTHKYLRAKKLKLGHLLSKV